MATHLVVCDDRTECGLRISMRRVKAGKILSVPERVTCQRCILKQRTFSDALALAKYIHSGSPEVVQFLMDVKTVEGLPGKVYFNKKSKKKKHFILVKEEGVWRRIKEGEKLLMGGFESGNDSKPGALAADLGAVSNGEESAVLAGSAPDTPKASDV